MTENEHEMSDDLASRLERWLGWQKEERVHLELTFCIDAMPELFAGWVTEHIRRLWSYEYPDMTWTLDHRKFRTEYYPLPGPGKPSTASYVAITLFGASPDIIKFTMVPLGFEIIEITATCYWSMAMSYFVDLLLEIDGTWPGVIAEALDHLGDFDEEALAETTEQESADEPSPRGEFDDPIGGLYGTCRDMTIEEVRAIVKKCLEFKKKGGKTTEFYRRRDIVSGEPKSYELETLRSWLKDSRFRPRDT